MKELKTILKIVAAGVCLLKAVEAIEGIRVNKANQKSNENN